MLKRDRDSNGAPMEAIEALTSRRSPAQLVEPAPDDETRPRSRRRDPRARSRPARPWRFIVVRGAARERLGDVLVEALKARAPDVPANVLERERAEAAARAADRRGRGRDQRKATRSRWWSNCWRPAPRPRTSCWRRMRWDSARCGAPATAPMMPRQGGAGPQGERRDRRLPLSRHRRQPCPPRCRSPSFRLSCATGTVDRRTAITSSARSSSSRASSTSRSTRFIGACSILSTDRCINSR